MVTRLPQREWATVMSELIETEGWKLLVEEWRHDLQSLNQVKEITDNDHLNFVKGRIEEITSILDLPKNRCGECLITSVLMDISLKHSLMSMIKASFLAKPVARIHSVF